MPTACQLPDVESAIVPATRSEEHTSEFQSHLNLVCRLLLEKKKKSSECQSHSTLSCTRNRRNAHTDDTGFVQAKCGILSDTDSNSNQVRHKADMAFNTNLR